MAKESKKTLTQQITEYLNQEIEDSQDKTIQRIFGGRDYKVGDYFYQADSLRLRSAGYQLLKMYFDHEEFVHERPFYTGEILTISQNMNAPFYITQDKITLFSNEHIVMCKLAGNVTSWLENMS